MRRAEPTPTPTPEPTPTPTPTPTPEPEPNLRRGEVRDPEQPLELGAVVAALAHAQHHLVQQGAQVEASGPALSTLQRQDQVQNHNLEQLLRTKRSIKLLLQM